MFVTRCVSEIQDLHLSLPLHSCNVLHVGVLQSWKIESIKHMTLKNRQFPIACNEQYLL